MNKVLAMTRLATPRPSIGKSSQQGLSHLLAILICVIMCIPIYLVVINSLKDRTDARRMSIERPTTLHWENFSTVIEQGNLENAFVNSMLYSTGSTLLATTAAAMAAYVMSRNKTRLNRFLYFFIIMGIAMPVNFFTLTKVMQVTHLINTQVGIVLLYAAAQLPFNTFLIYGFVEALPRDLDEAAIIDGAGPFRLFFGVIFPLMTPVLVTAALLSFLATWNDFIFPLYYLNDTSKWPMPLAVYNFFGRYQSSFNLVSADIVLTVLPVVAVYLLGQRFIVSGMTAGSVKG
ncbi:MAG TPA: carbohydrate ABC transporter permease [Aggregatilineaceae bacterium]|nr:carbohydrate ABC transporter permease [Aggregatilineaceae bacterium]